MRMLALYRCFLKTMINHKTDMFMSFLHIVITQVVSIITLSVVLDSVPVLQGFRHDEIMLMYGLFWFNKGLASMVTAGLYGVEGHVRDGSFDGILVRPLSPIIQVLAEKLELGEVVNIVTGFCVVAKMLRTLRLFKFGNLIVVFIYAFLSLIIVFSIRLLCMSLSFWTLTSFPVAIATDNVSEFARYPSKIYGRFLDILLNYALPYAVLSYVPATVIINDLKELIVYSLFITVFFLGIALLVWKNGIRHYKSSGH